MEHYNEANAISGDFAIYRWCAHTSEHPWGEIKVIEVTVAAVRSQVFRLSGQL